MGRLLMHSTRTRLGLIFFTIYTLIYASFVVLSAFWPETMEEAPWAGVNVAILYGFALIITAFAMSMLYGYLCNRTPDDSSKT
ncbi:MAG: DUF485 domain-containing protein [Planctomycetaceae bacterium]